MASPESVRSAQSLVNVISALNLRLTLSNCLSSMCCLFLCLINWSSRYRPHHGLLWTSISWWLVY